MSELGDGPAGEAGDLIERLKNGCTDYDGSQMPDGAEPIHTVTCGEIRALTADLAKARKFAEDGMSAVKREAERRIEASDRTAAALRTALEPLLTWLANLEAEFPDSDEGVIVGGVKGNVVTFRDLRSIRAAVKAPQS